MSRIWLAVALFIGAFLFVMGGVFHGLLEQRSVNQRLCEVTVRNRDATIGIWEGARKITLQRGVNNIQRFAIDQFFAAVLAPYPPLQCVDQRPVPVVTSDYILASLLSPPPPKKPDPQPNHGQDDDQRRRRADGACLVFIPGTCPAQPSQSKRPANVPAGDRPPSLSPLAFYKVWRKTISVVWEASDDHGIVRFRFYRDGRLVSRGGPHQRSARFWFPCGPHSFAVEVIDSVGQSRARSIGLIRAGCRS